MHLKIGLILMNKYHIYEDIIGMNEMVELKKSHSLESLNICFQLIQPLLEWYQEYDVFLSDQSSNPMADFWNSYLRMVQNCVILLNQLNAATGTCIFMPQKRCFIGFMHMVITIMLVTFPITGHHK